MRVIIAGSRSFTNYNLLVKKCIKIFFILKSEGYNTQRDFIEIISGTAKGADKLGKKFAHNFQLSLIKFHANWEKYGKSAGYKRNVEMARYASQSKKLGVLIAFWDGTSKGTKHMLNIAKEYGLRVYLVRY